MLFSAIPFLITERSFEYFLFYAVTGMIAIALIYGRRKTGVFTDVIVVFILVYVLLYTGLIILKRLSLTPGLIIAPIVMLILDVVIMKITGYRYYTDVVKVEEELAEVKEAAAADDAKALEEELGDLLFTVVNLCRWKNLQAEEVIHGGIRKFVERFKKMESLIHVKGSTPEEMMEAWRKAKESLKPKAES